jgi:hypothetical protein
MGENEESFRDKLIKMAQIVELSEDIFKNSKKITINVDLDDNEFTKISRNLNKNIKDESAIISIGDVEFIFLKK